MPSEDSEVKMQKKSEAKEEPKDQDPKKITTKDMIHQALTELKSRKGTSLYAIKKYIEEKYKVDVEKLNYVIKKSLKSSVEAGTIIQTKGIGASGSFRLAPGADKPGKKKKPKAKKSVEKPTTSKKSATTTKEKLKKTQSTEKDDSAKQKKKVEISKPASPEKKDKSQKESKKTMKKEVTMKKSKMAEMAEEAPPKSTPAKKKSAMMKRKSIGSIIKPPKMNPKKG